MYVQRSDTPALRFWSFEPATLMRSIKKNLKTNWMLFCNRLEELFIVLGSRLLEILLGTLDRS